MVFKQDYNRPMKALLSLAFLLILTAQTAQAFNWDNCKNTAYAGLGGGWFTSTTQWSSSWGACSMVGASDFSKKTYFANNFDSIKLNAVTGRGEYLATLETILDCKLSVPLKKNYQSIFDGPPKESYKKLKSLSKIENLGCAI
jgi:hypothetical protein